MIKDINKHIDSIKYNLLNLPERITGTRPPCNEDAMVLAFVMPVVWMEE